jgi:YD repeat-containing protein
MRAPIPGSRPRNFAAALAFTLAAIIVAILSAPPIFANITYVYDPDGRLIVVVDGSGNAASYNYDNEGNLQTISRSQGSTVSIFAVSPNNGPTGVTVTVYGNNFSTTPSQDLVYFCGVSQQCGTAGVQATVQSATSTTLVVTVPSNARTGYVTVQCPNGTANGGTYTVS